MKINNKIKRSLSWERWGKASKNKESLWCWNRKWESFFLEKWSIPKKTCNKNKKEYIVLNVGDKIKASENVFPESVDPKKPLHRTDWYACRRTMEWYIIEEVSVNRLGKPKYTCLWSDWEKYIIKQYAWHKPLELFTEDV